MLGHQPDFETEAAMRAFTAARTPGRGRVTLLGAETGYVHAAGGSVYINGPVGDDVLSHAGSVQLGPGARIAGRLRYASREELKRDLAAQVAGGVERIDFTDGMASTNAARCRG